MKFIPISLFLVLSLCSCSDMLNYTLTNIAKQNNCSKMLNVDDRRACENSYDRNREDYILNREKEYK